MVLAGLLLSAAGLLGACAAGSGPNDFTGTGGAAASSSSTGDIHIDPGHGGMGGMAPDPKTCEEAAASKAYVGCEFWPTVLANLVSNVFDYAVVVANAGDEVADVTVTRAGAPMATAQVPPNGLRTIYLPWVEALKGIDPGPCDPNPPYDTSVRADGGAYHLVSSRPVTVYQFNALEYQGKGGPPGKDWSACPGDVMCGDQPPTGCFSFTNDASLLLPSTAMTGSYRITAERDGAALGNMPAYIGITGTEEGTSVTVYVAPGAHVVAGGGIPDTPGGGSFTVTLGAGDVVEVFTDGLGDLGGSLVKASAPVQVIAGTPCAYEPLDGTRPACDHLEETVLPAETLGQHYFVASPTTPSGGVAGQVVRLFGNVDGTKLTYLSANPPIGAPETLDAGQVVDLGIVADDFEIAGDHEFAVATFMLGASLVDPGVSIWDSRGDPSQSLAVPVEQYRTKYVFLAPTDYDVSYVDVIQPMSAEVRIDGAPTKVAPVWIGSGFGIARIPLGVGNDGAHVLTASAPVGIQVMGYGSYTSYQYPGGLNLISIAPPPPPPL
ncbi:Hemagglutinin/hemolysin-related protein [Minicystis rosea]|nr:Hemagglutinin/hemolysin-related protein [Minicystis rosea]